MKKLLILSLALGLGAAACGIEDQEIAAPKGAATAAQTGGDTTGGDITPTFSGTVAPILASSCSTCHNAASATGGIDLSSFASIISISGLVSPSNPDASLLVSVLEGGRMPPATSGKPVPSTTDIQNIRDWVAAGALND